jgi:hypothetical protein
MGIPWSLQPPKNIEKPCSSKVISGNLDVFFFLWGLLYSQQEQLGMNEVPSHFWGIWDNYYSDVYITNQKKLYIVVTNGNSTYHFMGT